MEQTIIHNNRLHPTAIHLFLLLLFVSSFKHSFAQFTDNFSDGDFTNNPTWNSDVPANWIIDNGRLRSNSSMASSTFYISTSSSKVTNAQWEFFVNLTFNTSSANFVDVYLVSENENLLSAGNNGYFVRIGGTPDEISFYKITGGTISLLINGTDGVTNFSNNVLRVKVTRDQNNIWTLSYDTTGTGNNYFSEPTATDASFNTSNYFGIRITQSTSSFFNRHFFDDFIVGDIVLDLQPPTLISTTPVSANQLDVLFSEKVESASSQAITNYTANNGIGQPQTAVLQTNERTVRLSFQNNFSNGVTNQLTVSNVKDLAGNAMTSSVISFFFFQPQPVSYKDIIITEIFADPTPVIGLPEAECIELYNRSTNPINLMGWKFSDGSSTATLPSHILMPGAYLIITPTASAPSFSAFGATIGVASFPTLNNTGDNLSVRDATTLLIDEVNYSDAWYKDDDKKQGGWTLELIDIDNICAEEENWVASTHPSGGTPGTVNSVKATKPDLTGPKLLSAIPVSTTKLKLSFDEKLSSTIPTTTDFVITPTLSVVTVSFTSPGLREINLDLASPIQSNQTYSIAVSNIRDCGGNLIQEAFRTVSFGFPETATPLDVLINEILFNPKPFGVDFLEVYNQSNKYINLKNWNIGNFENGIVNNPKPITTTDFLLAPGAILVLTVDPLTIKSHYPLANQSRILKISSTPSFPDDAGSAALVNDQGIVIDNFTYSNAYHSVFLRDKEGVSLERIHPDVQSNDPNNWKSASSTVGYATPGYRNSNALNEQAITGEVKIEPEIFAPLFSQPDFTEIQYNFDQGGRVANIKILDQQGREIKKIANNEILATSGFFRWDGDRDDGTKVRPGYYLVWFEVFDTSGRVETFRKRVVVAARY